MISFFLREMRLNIPRVYDCVCAAQPQYCLAVKHHISGAVDFDTPQLYFV